MRTRERLIEVLQSVNGSAAGVWPFHAFLLDETAVVIKGKMEIFWHIDWMKMLAAHPNASPHIRELATEALFYMQKDSTNG